MSDYLFDPSLERRAFEACVHWTEAELDGERPEKVLRLQIRAFGLCWRCYGRERYIFKAARLRGIYNGITTVPVLVP